VNWFSLDQIIAVNRGELPASKSGMSRFIAQTGWRTQSEKARKSNARGGGWLYHISLLPNAIQARLSLNTLVEPVLKVTPERQAMWHRYEGLSKDQKTGCETRLNVLLEIETLKSSGMGDTASARMVAALHKISLASLFN